MNDNFDTMMESERPQLTTAERASMFVIIEGKVNTTAQSIRSPYLSFMYSRGVYAALVLAIVLGASGTVLASEEAKPGDLLFPIDRAREEVRLALASDEREAMLREQFTAERLEELREIITEENDSGDDSKRRINENGEIRVGSAVTVLLDYIDRIEDEKGKQGFLQELKAELDTLEVTGRGSKDKKVWSDDVRLEVKDDRIEIRDGETRVRIDSDGEVRIKQDDDSDGDSGHSGDDNDDSFDDSDSGFDLDEEDDSDEEFEDEADDSDDSDDDEDREDRDESEDDSDEDDHEDDEDEEEDEDEDEDEREDD